MNKIVPILATLISLTAGASAAVVTFTGGTVTLTGGGTGTTDGSANFSSVDFYTESGFKFGYLGGTGGSMGNYYGTGNDVIHAHWGVGEMTHIEITKVDGGTFDFNYFVLTSNTLSPGGQAIGTENVYVQAWLNGSQVGSDFQLPPEDWGLVTTKDVFFNADFDLVDKVVITSPMTSFSCFGMDAFYIDQAAPVPEPSAAALMVLGAGALVALKRRRGV